MTFLDTHVIVWLYEKKLELFPKNIQEILEEDDLDVSPIVVLELEYLFECKKIKVRGKKIVDYLIKNLGLAIADESFSDVIRNTILEDWTRDPFDRVITAHARMKKATLLTKDKVIRKN